MTLDFREPQLSDKPAVDEIFYNQTLRVCEYTFGNIFIWRHLYKTVIAFEDGFLFVRALDGDGKVFYLFPAGVGDIKGALERIREDAAADGRKPVFYAVTDEMRQALERFYPGHVRVTELRDAYDYIYNTQDLVTLPGKKYHGKRNHVARFEKLGEWTYEPVTAENLAECSAMNDEWCRLNGCGRDPGKKVEYCAVQKAFQNYGGLGFTGGMLRLDGRVVAFSMGERLSVDTFNTHIEKAFFDVEGAYAMINREFAVHACKGYAYINREEDMGVEGLRKAKLSYGPAILLRKDRAGLD